MIIGKYNSDIDLLDQTITSLSTITLVTHPRGENHEIVISYPNHELAII